MALYRLKRQSNDTQYYSNLLSIDRSILLPVLSSDNDEPCRDGGLDPARLAGREFGFEPPGVNPVRLGVYDGFRGVYRPPPKLLSLSLNESGVDADNDDRDGRDIATERAERSRT